MVVGTSALGHGEGQRLDTETATNEEAPRLGVPKEEPGTLGGAGERGGALKEMEETIYELQDEVEQHRAVRLHYERAVRDLEDKVQCLERRNLELEKQLKVFNKRMKEEAEEWRYFQADLQTAVVVANDIKCEAQQEMRELRRELQEERSRTQRLQEELEATQAAR